MTNSKKNILHSIICIISTIAILVLVFFMVKDIVLKSTKWLMFISAVGGILSGLIIHLFIHESMHLVFGVCAGFKPYAFNILGVTILKKNGRKIRVQKTNANGFCSMYFTKENHPYLRFSLFVFGGLFGSILVTTAGFLLMFLLKDINPYVYVAVSVTNVINTYILLSNLIPSTYRNMSNDGSQFFGILFKNAYSKLSCKSLIIQGKIINGMKPRDMDRTFIKDVPVIEDGATEKVVYQTFLYSYYLDCYTFNKDEEAKKEMDKIVLSLINSYEDILDVYKKDVAVLILYHLVKNNGDKKQIDEFYKEACEILFTQLTMDNLRVKMAYELYYLKNPSLALITGKTALIQKEDFIFQGLIELEEKLINESMRDCTIAIANEKIHANN